MKEHPVCTCVWVEDFPRKSITVDLTEEGKLVDPKKDGASNFKFRNMTWYPYPCM